MTSEIEQANFDRVDLKEVDGKIQLTFNHHSDWVIFLRKISIHKHLREDDDVNYFDDVLDLLPHLREDELLIGLDLSDEQIAIELEADSLLEALSND